MIFNFCFPTQADNFEMQQEGMKKQLRELHILVKFVDPQLCNYLGKIFLGTLIMFSFLPGLNTFLRTLWPEQSG